LEDLGSEFALGCGRCVSICVKGTELHLEDAFYHVCYALRNRITDNLGFCI
jgi:hypothetical protein